MDESYEDTSVSEPTVADAVAGGVAGRLPEPDEPPVASFVPPPLPTGRQISTLSARSFSYGSMEIFDDLIMTHLKREISGCTYLSDFDITSQGGTVHRRCKRCTFMNRGDVIICQACESALITMTNVEEQMALLAQCKQDDDGDKKPAAADIDKKQKHSWEHEQGVIYQAQQLAQEILQVVQGDGEFRGYYLTFPDIDLTMSLVRFIQAYQEDSRQNASKIHLAYTFVPKNMYDTIREEGFPKNTSVWADCDIGMNMSVGSGHKENSETIGFIVAVIYGPQSRYLGKSSQILALVNFPLSLCKSRATAHLFERLSECMQDFFGTIHG